MSNPSPSRLRLLPLSGLVALPLLCLAAKEFSMPKVQPAASYPNHDYHSREKVTVALDPYDAAPKTNIFVVPYHDLNLLPVLLIVTNDSDNTVNLTGMKLDMITARRDKLTPLGLQDVVRRIQKAVKRPDSPRVSPIPLPRRKPKPGVSQDTMDELDAAMFHAMAVEPHTTRAGFVFFDYEGISNPLAGGTLTINGLTTSDGKDLFFFEIAMEKYLTYQPGKTP